MPDPSKADEIVVETTILERRAQRIATAATGRGSSAVTHAAVRIAAASAPAPAHPRVSPSPPRPPPPPPPPRPPHFLPHGSWPRRSRRIRPCFRRSRRI